MLQVQHRHLIRLRLQEADYRAAQPTNPPMGVHLMGVHLRTAKSPVHCERLHRLPPQLLRPALQLLRQALESLLRQALESLLLLQDHYSEMLLQ